MAKNPRNPKQDRRATDGGICVVDVSPVLTNREPTAGQGGPEGHPQGFDIILSKVNMAVIDKLSIGSQVTFSGEGIELTAYVRSYPVGYVAPKDRRKVISAMKNGAQAWIRDIYDKGVAVRVEW